MKRRGNWEVSVGEKGIRSYYQAVGDAPGGGASGRQSCTEYYIDGRRVPEREEDDDTMISPDSPITKQYQTLPNITIRGPVLVPASPFWHRWEEECS